MSPRELEVADPKRRSHDRRVSKTPPGIPEPREGIQIQVLQKLDRAWRIAAFQNTSSLPETPFPTEASGDPRSRQP
jgi:hypothetical protein